MVYSLVADAKMKQAGRMTGLNCKNKDGAKRNLPGYCVTPCASCAAFAGHLLQKRQQQDLAIVVVGYHSSFLLGNSPIASILDLAPSHICVFKEF
jgi:hypothetical protein